MDASLIHDTFEGQFAPAVAAQTCLFTAYVLRWLVAIARFEWLFYFLVMRDTFSRSLRHSRTLLTRDSEIQIGASRISSHSALFRLSMDKLLSSPCRNLFVAASKCIHEQGLQRPECKTAQSALYACTRKHKLAAQHVTISRAGTFFVLLPIRQCVVTLCCFLACSLRC